MLSIHTYAHPTKEVTTRETYTFFDMFGDVGGLAEFVYVIIHAFVSYFARSQLTTETAAKLYSWKQPPAFKT